MQNLFSKTIKLDPQHSVSVIETAIGSVIVQGFNDNNENSVKIQQLLWRKVAIIAVRDLLTEYIDYSAANQGG